MADFRQKIENGDIEGVERLVKMDPTIINKPINEYGTTPLIFASKVGADRRIIEILIKAGPELEAKDRLNGWTALHVAVNWNHLQAVELLLSRGSNVNEKTNCGYTPLHLAASSIPEWTDGVKAIMKEEAVEVNPRDEDGCTPLHFACSWGNLHTVDLLLGHNGIDANVVANDGDTPLHKAVRGQSYKVVCAMLKQGSVQLDIQNNQKRTPLLEAVSWGHLGMTHKLIALGANVNAVDGEGNSCLHLAVEREVFDSEDAPLDLLNECCTSLNLKIEERLSGIVVARYLASQGADFHHKNNNNNTPLDLIKDPNLRRKLETFLPPQCLWCKNKTATIKFLPCGHFVTCETCSKISLKRCLKCGKPVTSRTGDDTKKLEEKDLLKVARQMGSKWWQVGIFLDIKTSELDIIKRDNSNDIVEQSYQMMYKWFTSCEPKKRTAETINAALEEAECYNALQCLSLDKN